MTKQIIIEVDDDKYVDYPLIVGDIIGAATYLEAFIEIKEV